MCMHGGLTQLFYYFKSLKGGSRLSGTLFYNTLEGKNMNEYVREAARRNGIISRSEENKPGKKKSQSISTRLKKSKNLRKATGHNAGMGGRMAAGYGEYTSTSTQGCYARRSRGNHAHDRPVKRYV